MRHADASLFAVCKDSSPIMVEARRAAFHGLERRGVSLEPVMKDADPQHGFEAWQKAGA
jgi:hypothetical protein